VTGDDNRFERLRVAVTFFNVPHHLHEPILRRWDEAGRPPLPEFARYTAYALTVELFFQMALAGDLISTERPSNRMDIAYLFYLPFCQVFISGDRLHRRCAPLFMRPNQEFVWALDLKADLSRMNAYYLAYPNRSGSAGLRHSHICHQSKATSSPHGSMTDSASTGGVRVKRSNSETGRPRGRLLTSYWPSPNRERLSRLQTLPMTRPLTAIR
jgi:hypothetical protein